MRFEPTDIRGVCLIRLDLHEDDRGFFARSWCAKEFEARGLPSRMVQANISFNRQAGTLRGLHFQLPPSREGKLVRCSRGVVFDVVVDVRCDSPTFLQSAAFELDDVDRLAVYVPPGVAHGFQTLADDSEVHYLMTDEYQAELGSGVRWNDPAFGIAWPLEPTGMSARDRAFPDMEPAAFDAFRGY